MEDKLYNDWLDLIPNKQIMNIEVENLLYNSMTKLNYIISFDVEFIRYAIENRQVQTIHELGGIILNKKNNKWYIICIFHINMIPLITNIKQYYLLTSNYNTITTETLNKVIEIEKKLLPEYISDIKLIKNNAIIKRYLSNSKIKKLINDKDIHKKLSKIKYMIKGSDLQKNEYELFTKSIELILSDPDVIKRQIEYKNQRMFIKLTNILFSNSYLIVKGQEDLKALKNHTLMLNENSIKLHHFFDIAKYNNLLFKRCNSAQLENTYDCLKKLNLTQKYDLYLKVIEKFTELKAHNPLVDAYYTLIIFNILKNLNDSI